jgi:hypothetical protein
MGYFRFRKTISVLPGVKINLSKTGVSTSPGTGLSYRTPATTQLLVLAVVAVIIVGIAYLIQPELVKAALHWWQPRWF